MASEQLDVVVDTWAGLQALERMALAKGDRATAASARAKVDLIETSFDSAWWMPSEALYADSRCNADDCVSEQEREKQGWTNVCQEVDQPLQQRIWVTVKPMETTIAPPERANIVLDRLESSDFSGPGGLFLVGAGGGPDGKAVRKAWTVMSGVMAIAEANYGRLGEQQALHYMRAIAATLDLEMPGALPELAPSPDYDPFGPFAERMMVMQAWASYGIAWPIVTNLLGVDPDVPGRKLAVVPQIPPSWPGLAISDLRMGSGAVSIATARKDRHYTITVNAPPGWTLIIGQTLAVSQTVTAVKLDSIAVPYTTRTTRRGQGIHVETNTDAVRTLIVAIAPT